MMKQKRMEKGDFKNEKDYELFLRDLEDDPELRANVNLYKDDDVISKLIAQTNKMTLNEEEESKL